MPLFFSNVTIDPCPCIRVLPNTSLFPDRFRCLWPMSLIFRLALLLGNSLAPPASTSSHSGPGRPGYSGPSMPDFQIERARRSLESLSMIVSCEYVSAVSLILLRRSDMEANVNNLQSSPLVCLGDFPDLSWHFHPSFHVS